MKAVVYDKSHRPIPLVLSDVPIPEPMKDEVLVKIAASTLNALDYRPLKMGFKFKKGQIFGADMVGTIVSCGSDATRFHPGDRVFGDLSDYGSGAFAEFVSVSEAALAPIPDFVGFEQAATLPVACITALQGLRKAGTSLAGKKILVYG
ncbi:MAG: alcohol dehydrogenase catalytic domain-containing protein, partial [Bacillota bacterium]|nr:alcohol dehydrogenase catalytic domain-containing protein [Bacillota bacterium]